MAKPTLDPDALRLAQTLQLLFFQQAREVAAKIRFDEEIPDLTHWNKVLVGAIQPLLVPIWQSSYYATATQLGVQPIQVHPLIGHEGMRFIRFSSPSIFSGTDLESRAFGTKEGGANPGSKSVQTKNWRSLSKNADLSRATSVLSPFPSQYTRFSPNRISVLPKLIDAVEEASLRFSKETNQSATSKLKETKDRLRAQLLLHFESRGKKGLTPYQARQMLVAGVQQIFANPVRATAIAITEISRAKYGGQVLAAKDSGLKVKKKWRVRGASCPNCLRLSNKVVALDTPFQVDPKGGLYAITMHPPLHPHCDCEQSIVPA